MVQSTFIWWASELNNLSWTFSSATYLTREKFLYFLKSMIVNLKKMGIIHTSTCNCKHEEKLHMCLSNFLAHRPLEKSRLSVCGCPS